MKNFSRKVLSVLLVFVILVPSFSFIAQALVPKSDEGMASFDLDDIIDSQKGKVDVGTDDNGDLSMAFSGLPDKSPISYNKDDAGFDAGKNLSYVGTLNGTNAGLYKVNDTSNVHIVESDVELQSDAEDYLDACLDNELLSDRELSGFLTASARLANADDPLTLSSHEENKTSKMRIVNESNTASGDIVVLDDDAIAIFVQDTNEDAIEKATVTIRYKDSSGGSKTRSVVTNYLGAAIFDNMKGVCFGAVDIQHANYRSKTTLNVEFTAGEAIYKYLEPKQENELYVRCADLDGLDMTEYDGEISVSDGDIFQQDLTYTIIVSKTGNKALPDKINICAENAGQKRVVKTLTKTSGTYSDGDTATYICKANWVSNSFFKNGDEIYYDIEPSAMLKSGSVSSTKSGAKVADAKSKIPIWTNTKYGFLDGIASYTIPDTVPGIGGSNVGFDTFKCPVGFAVLPDGSVFMSYGINFINKGKPEDIVSASWNPAKAEQAKGFFEKAHDEFLSKVNQFQEGKDFFVNRSAEAWTAVDYSKRFRVDLIFSAVGNYDNETNRVSVKFGAVVSVSGSFGMTWYVMIPIGPATLPGYAGFNASVNGRAAGNITLSMDIKKDSMTEMLNSIKIETSKDGQAGISLDVILSLAAYVGVGLHGLADLEVQGSVYADFGVDIISSAMVEYDKHTPRFKVSAGYRVDLSATFMWFKFNKKLAGDSKIFYDSWGLNKSKGPLNLVNDPNTSVEKIDLEASQSPLTKVVGNGDSEVEQYKISQSFSAGGDSESRLIDGKTINGGSPRYIHVGKYSVLFRMMPIDGRVRVVYQLMEFDGSLSNVVNVLPLPDRNANQKNNDVTQFDVFAYDKFLCIAMIGCSADEDEVSERAKTTYAVTEAFSIESPDTLFKRVADANPNGEYLSNPVAIYSSKGSKFYRCGYSSTNLETERTTWHYSDYTKDSDVQNIYVQEYRYASDWSSYNMIFNPIGFRFISADGDNIVYKPVCPDTYSEEKSGTLEFNYKDITGSSWDGKTPIISAYKSIQERLFVVIGGRLCYIKYNHPDPDTVKFTVEQVKDKHGDTVELADSDIYDFQWGSDGAMCLVSISGNYDEDGEYANSNLCVYRITNPYGIPVVHGPAEYTMHISEPSNFTAVVDSPTGTCTAFYTKPIKSKTTDEGVTDSAQLYQWTQQGFSRVNVQAVVFTKGYISAKDETMPLTVVCKNNGTNHVDSVKLIIYLDKVDKYLEKSYPVDIYPGDTATIDMTDTPKPATWTTAKVHSIGVRSDIDGGFSTNSFTAAEENDMYVVDFDISYLKMSIDTKFVGGRHRAFVTITNESIVASQTPVLQLVGKFKKTSPYDTNNERVIKNIELPVRQLTDADYSGGNAQGIKYNTMIDLDEIWEQYINGEDVLYSITVKLVPKKVANGAVTGEEAEMLCNSMPESVYIANPNISKVVNINANPNAIIMGKVDGNGIYNIGDTVELKATPAVGHKFLGWYSGDELVSKDMEIKFNATENLNYVAKFAPTVSAVQVDDVKMNYKQTIKLNTVVDSDDGTEYTVTYTSSDPNIVSVDIDGNVTALKRGNAIVTCTVTDIYGNQKQDTCLVTVKYSPWQWIIKILLFGWIWY